MILDTMTQEELLREIKSDYSEVVGRWRNFQAKFRKTVQKRASYPWLWETYVKTRRHNEWYISYYAEAKKESDIVNAMITLTFKYKGQLWTGTVMDDVTLIFAEHFFERYKERFMKIHKDSKVLSDKDIMKMFFILNSNLCFLGNEKEDNIRGYCYDGIFYGDWIGKEGGMVKTFLSRQEMKINQFTEYFEVFKMWIIQDMFKARKGMNLNSSLIKYIPDTYFEYNEWNRFLFERGNLRLIRAAEECNEIYIKNTEQYRRCREMIDAVNQNMYEKKNSKDKSDESALTKQ